MLNNDLGQLYDEKLKEYEDIRNEKSDGYKHYIQTVISWKIKYLVKTLPPHQEFEYVLEVGCGTGDLIKNIPLNTCLSNRYGLDISKKNISEARIRYPEINFFAQKFEEFILNTKIKFNLIIFSDILEHVPNDIELLRLAGKYSQYVLLNLPLEKCYEFRNREYGQNDYRGHLRDYDINDARKLIHEAGLEEINYYQKYYVKQTVFKKYLWNKLVIKRNFYAYLKGLIQYILEVTEIFFRYKRYKSNYFAYLKSK